MTFIEPLQVSVQGDLNEFYKKLQSNLVEGIEEENNIAELREALPYYINGSWYEFLEALNEKIFSKVSETNNSLQDDIVKSVENLLTQVLTDDEYNEIHDLILDALYKKSQDDEQFSTPSESNYIVSPIVVKEKNHCTKHYRLH